MDTAHPQGCRAEPATSELFLPLALWEWALLQQEFPKSTLSPSQGPAGAASSSLAGWALTPMCHQPVPKVPTPARDQCPQQEAAGAFTGNWGSPMLTPSPSPPAAFTG